MHSRRRTKSNLWEALFKTVACEQSADPFARNLKCCRFLWVPLMAKSQQVDMPKLHAVALSLPACQVPASATGMDQNEKPQATSTEAGSGRRTQSLLAQMSTKIRRSSLGWKCRSGLQSSLVVSLAWLKS